MDEYNFVPLSLEEDEEEVVALIRDQLLPREPTALGIGATPEDQLDFYTPSIIECLKSGMSLGVKYGSSGKLVGIMLNNILTPTKKSSVAEPLISSTKNRVETILQSIYDEVDSAVDLFEKYNVQKVFFFDYLCTHEEHVGKGIGKALVEKSELLGVDNGCQLGNVITSNLASQAIFTKRGYSTYLTYEFSKNSNIDLNKTEGSKGWLMQAKRF